MSNEQKKHHAALFFLALILGVTYMVVPLKRLMFFIVTNTLIKQIRKSEISKYRVFSTLCFMFHIL